MHRVCGVVVHEDRFASMSIRLKGCSFIVADANSQIRSILATMVAREGARVLASLRTSTEALATIGRLQADIAIFDLHLMEASIPDALRTVIADNPETAVVVMGLDDQRGTARLAMDCGALGYIRKPLNEANILTALLQVKAIMAFRKSRQAVPKSEGPQHRAVIVDCDVLARGLLRVILEDNGFEVVAEAASGFEGLMAVERHEADFVCLAVDLPEIDGLNTVACLHAVHPDLPVLMVTAHADRETVSAAIRGGVHDYVIKPFEAERVIAAVRKALA